MADKTLEELYKEAVDLFKETEELQKELARLNVQTEENQKKLDEIAEKMDICGKMFEKLKADKKL